MLLSNALELAQSETSAEEDSALPVWAASSVAALAREGMELDAQTLTRAQAAQVLYQTHCILAAEQNPA